MSYRISHLCPTAYPPLLKPAAPHRSTASGFEKCGIVRSDTTQVCLTYSLERKRPARPLPCDAALRQLSVVAVIERSDRQRSPPKVSSRRRPASGRDPE